MEVGVRIVGFFLLFLDYFTRPVFWLLSQAPKKKISPINDPLLLNSATKLAYLIRTKQISSEHVVEVFIERAKEVNPCINAIVEERFKAAIQEAKKVDALLEIIDGNDVEVKKLEETSPFLGVPMTVKESCAVAGMSICVGSLPRSGMKAMIDSDAVATMRAAGAIPILVSNTPELCLSWESNNFVTGKTCNPYSPHRTSGGSSGGEAALIASGASVIGIASDIAGSIRIPAMFNGLFGHKPTPGLISINGHYPASSDENFSKFLTIGPITRYSEDLLPMLKTMAGKNKEAFCLDKAVDLKEIKVLYMMEAGKSFVMIPVDKDIQIAMRKALEYLKTSAGCDTKEVNFEEMAESVELSVSVFFGMEDIPNMLKDESNPKLKKNLYLEILKTMLGFGSYSLQSLGFYLIHDTNLFIPKKNYSYYCKQVENLKAKLESTLGDCGVFIYPTFPIPAFYHSQVYTKTAGVLYTMIFNVLGLPSTHVPLGLNSDGLPIGVQVIAASKQDRLCLAVARELERGFGGWIQP